MAKECKVLGECKTFARVQSFSNRDQREFNVSWENILLLRENANGLWENKLVARQNFCERTASFLENEYFHERTQQHFLEECNTFGTIYI